MTVSDVQLDSAEVEQDRVSHWNETMANRLEKITNRRPNAALQSVEVTPEAVIMTWQVTK